MTQTTGILDAVARRGRAIDETLRAAGFSVRLLIRVILALPYLPRRMRFTLDSAYAAGVRSLGVALVVAFFAGMILALQTGIELRRLGQSNLIGSILALSMCREMGPFITGIILAATVGSAMAAEIGTMSVSDEVTALDVMSIDSANFLALPRVVALTAMCPLLTALADAVGIAGGAVVSHFHLGITQQTYWVAVRESLTETARLLPKDVYVGIFKAVVFGAAISTVSVASGLRAHGGALGVGRAVQRAVMVSILLIIILGYVITWLFYFLLRE
jgi:phospholipid/cholesterol/gamma-HCH transport system permease protein